MSDKNYKIKSTMRHPTLKGGVWTAARALDAQGTNSILKDGVFVKFLDMSENIRVLKRRGQISLWVIIALVLVAGLAAYLMVRNSVVIEPPQGDMDPIPYIQSCTRGIVDDALKSIMPQGGFTNPQHYRMFEGTKVVYICYNEGYYNPCVHQHPMFISEVQQEIAKTTEIKIGDCFNELKRELEKQKYSVNLGEMNLYATLGPDYVQLNIARQLTLSKRDAVKTYDQFSVRVKHPVYDLASVAMEIASQEAKYCYFEYVGYMVLYPRFDIKKFTMSEATKIYTIKDMYSGTIMNIAVRGCAIPGGL